MAKTAVGLTAHSDMDFPVTAEQVPEDRAEQREDQTEHQTDRIDNRNSIHNSPLR